MGINLLVAVKDKDWFDLQIQQTDLKGVNFWSHSHRNFQALKQGVLFLLKPH